jgi:cytochrome b-561
MLIYRLLRTTTKLYVKILHATIQVAVLVFATIALKAVFDSHNKATKPIPNMYSLHSWVGLAAVILFGLQWVAGFVSFLFPKLSDGLRRWYLPHHKFWGLAIFVMCVAAALMGITEKAFFSLPSGKYSELPGEGVLINFFGSFIVIYAVLVVYLVTKHDYARPPEP